VDVSINYPTKLNIKINLLLNKIDIDLYYVVTKDIQIEKDSLVSHKKSHRDISFSRLHSSCCSTINQSIICMKQVRSMMSL